MKKEKFWAAFDGALEKVLNQKWLSGKLVIPYNLKWLVLVLLALLIVPFITLYWLGKALWWLAKVLVNGAKAFWAWLLPLLIAFWLWLKSLFARKSRQKEPATEKKPRDWRWLWWLAALILLLLLLGLLKDCSCEGERSLIAPTGQQQEVTTPEQVWSDVVIYRIHLDTLRNDARLIGLRYRNQRRAGDAEFNGDALGESEAVVQNEWTNLVKENVHVQLNRYQVAATVLYAMRSGQYGFKKSGFLKSLNDGDFTKAAEGILKLHRADGGVRRNGREAHAYLSELRLIFEGKLSVEEVLDCHRLSYLYYTHEGYEPELLKQIIQTKAGQNSTVRQILERAEAQR